VIGGDEFCVMADQCRSNRRTRFWVGEGVAKAGAKLLRGGAFKPRTSPYISGYGRRRIEAAAEAKKATGLAIVTE